MANVDVEEPTEIRSRVDRLPASVHFGDVDFDTDVMMDATWGEVCQQCCVHTPEEWCMNTIGVAVTLVFLYFFLFGLELLGSAAKVMSGCEAGQLFGDDFNPIAGVMVGIISTVLLQSSSTTTSIVVSLVGPDSSISVNQGIYMVMGANIGTTVTNTIVAMGQMGDGDQLERAFAGATVHDLFNILTVCILLPVEVVTHYLAVLTGAMVANYSKGDGEDFDGPVKQLVAPLSNLIIMSNKEVIHGVASGETCGDFYPISCSDLEHPTYETCSKVGLIACNQDTGNCPAFFDSHASVTDDKVSGGVCFFLAIVILFTCLIGLVSVLQKMLLGVSTRIVYKATNLNGYLAMLIGTGITAIVQSSSITTSALTPLVGIGVLRLEQMYPLTLGANMGTTVTAIMAALVADGPEALQVALAHLFFNITGILIWYPIPFMRRVPLNGARKLGQATRLWRGFPLLYIFTVFFLVPLMFLGLSALFEQHTKGWTVLGSFLVIIIGVVLGYSAYWCHFMDGKAKTQACFQSRQRRCEAFDSLPEDMQFLKTKVNALIDHTGLPEEEEDDDEAPPKKKESELDADDQITEDANISSGDVGEVIDT